MRRSRSLIGLTLVTAAVVLVTAGSGVLLALDNFAAANRTVLGVRDRQVALEQVLSVMRDAETGQRGFLLTQREAYLEPYTAALNAMEPLLARLTELLADDPPQQRALLDLQTQVARQRAELAETVDLMRSGATNAALDVVLTDTGRVTMDRIRGTIAQMQAVEDRQAAQAVESAGNARTIALGSVAALTALALMMLVVLLYVAHRSFEQIRNSEQRLAITLRSIGDAVIATDSAGRIMMLNPAAERLTGWTSHEAAGQGMATVFRIINEHTRATVENPIDKVLREGTIVGLANHTLLVARNGVETPIEDSAAPIVDAHGHLHGVVLVFRDASTGRSLQRTLLEADRRKNEFLAILAHELRNPLAPIRHAALIARSASATPEQIDWSNEIIERQVGHMARLLDDLLDVSRITRGTLEIRRTTVAVARIVEDATEMARPLIDARRHAFDVELPDEPLWLDADPLRIAQVLGNLLTNAAKFTDVGGRIALKAVRDGAEVELSVTDSGIGLAPETVQNIFQMFVQVSPPLERTESGLGIGLALSKALVDLHGGHISAESAGKGHGTTIRVRLPLVAAPSAITAPPQAAAADAQAAGLVLVADDNRDGADSLAALLRLAGHRVVTVNDGNAALEEIERLRPRIALLDIGMPGKTGYDVAAHVRAQPWGAGVTLVALTGWGQATDRERALAVGFDEHWVKPVDVTKVVEFCAAKLGSPQPQ
jgi:PAS domain S-box-containing protein